MSPYFIKGPALVSFSGGRTSAYMLRHIVQAHGGTLPADVHVVFFNTGKEMPETLDFVQACADRWDVPVTWLEFDPAAEHETRIVDHMTASRAGEPFAALIAQKGYMLPNPTTRYCTTELKVRRGMKFMTEIQGYRDGWISVIGLRADEPRRVAKAKERVASGKDGGMDVAMPLHLAGITKRDIAAFWREQNFDLRLVMVNGTTPEGNCDLCFLKGAATVRGMIRRRPELARWWIDQEAQAWDVRKDRFDNPLICQFTMHRPGFAALLEQTQRQGELSFDAELDAGDESIDCNCTD